MADKQIVGVEELGKALADAITTAQENMTGQRRRIPFGAHTPRSAFNPSGKPRKLQKLFHQGGRLLLEQVLTDAEITLLHLIKPGRYIDGLVTVIETATADGPAVFINYNSATADQRLALGSRLQGPGHTGFERMLNIIIKEREQQDADEKARRKKEIEDALA